MKKRISRITVAFLCIAMLAWTLSACGSSEEGGTLGEVTANPENTLEYFALTRGVDENGKINYRKVDDKIACSVWNKDSGEFEETDFSNDVIKGNYVRLLDNDGNKKADAVEVVNFEDGTAYWDPEMAWAKGAGTEKEPALSDEDGIEIYGQEWVIPYGERLLSGFGVEDESATVDVANIGNSTYHPDLDYYHATSNDTLTMLTGYKTYQQPSSWSCSCCSTICMLEWYGVRGDLNDYDLATLREGKKLRTGTYLPEYTNMLRNLEDLGITGKWVIQTTEDDPDALFDSKWIQKQLKKGHPIIIGMNSYGSHASTIIGYDNMGTPNTNDDVCIMMDSFDTTDHSHNGYYIEPYERLAYGLSTDDEVTPTHYVVAYPEGWKYDGPVMGDGIQANQDNAGVFNDKNKMGYGNTAKDIKKYYPDTEELGNNGLSGAAMGGYERSGDHDNSPYYLFHDVYNLEPSDTLHILTNFQTLQQSTEWTCGTASALMVMNWFGKNEDETDVSLATHRQGGEEGATLLKGMKELFTYMNDEYGQDWVWVSKDDLDDPEGEESYIGDYCLQAGTEEDWYGLVPYLIDQGIPIMVGSDEWGGHWQVIIGYDDQGTATTSDDVLIYADPYDTTDHNQDGYYIDDFDRLMYGWYSDFEGYGVHNDFLAAFPAKGHGKVIKELGAANK